MPHDQHANAAGDGAQEHPFAPFIRTLGRGPGKSRALTRDEAFQAMSMLLRGEADPHQVGAFLMLLRYRGEDAAEMAGLVQAARDSIGCGALPGMAVDLDWPSYGAGKTRGAPWFLLAALALAQAGHRIVMHGSNAFSTAIPVAQALRLLGLRAAHDRDDAAMLVAQTGFAYLPLTAFAPALDHLLGLRMLLGLRSPINTLARLLDPFDAGIGLDGVFHPPYIALHLAAAEQLGRKRLLVVKGGGGEAERTPQKPVSAHLWEAGSGRAEWRLPATIQRAGSPEESMLAVWQGKAEGGPGAATVVATMALALLALGATTADQADRLAAKIWRARKT